VTVTLGVCISQASKVVDKKIESMLAAVKVKINENPKNKYSNKSKKA
jgi:hypothetical protein